MKLEIIERIPLERTASASRLGAAYLTGDTAALPFYRFAPSDLAGAAAARREASATGRADLVDALRTLNASLGAGPATMANVDLLRQPGTLAVVTGQQTAPFTGPLYTVLKAAAAVRLAARVRRELGVECVPVFWAEGDDHDAAEISRVALGWGDGTLRRLTLEWPPAALGGPIGDLVPPRGWEALRREAAELLPATEFREKLLDLLFATAGEGTTLGRWFGSLLLSFFGSHGLVVAYSRDQALRLLWREMIPRVIEEAPALMEEVDASTRAIRAAGFKPQLHKKEGDGPFFIIEKGKRIPVRLAPGGFTVGRRAVTRDELARRLAETPAAFSPGVVLRPVIQDLILPTVAYVGGLAEASYFGQLTGAYRRLGVPMPVVAPRLFATFVEPGRLRIIKRHHLDPSRFLRETPDRIFASLLRRKGKLADPQRWDALAEKSRAPLMRFGISLPPEQEPLRKHLEKVAGQIGHLVRDAGERTAREERAREEQTRLQIEQTSFQLFPEGSLMERTLGGVYFLAKYGPDFPGGLVDSMPEDLRFHYLLGLGGTA